MIVILQQQQQNIKVARDELENLVLILVYLFDRVMSIHFCVLFCFVHRVVFVVVALL